MVDTSPHAAQIISPLNQETAVPPTCEICGCSLIGITSIHNRCSPCFWARSQNQDPKLWKEGLVNSVKLCAHQHCPFDASPGQAFCLAHEPKNILSDKTLDKTLDKICSALKFDDGKLPLDLLPFEALEEITLVLKHGKEKYGAHNWRSGFTYSRPFSAILRHLFAYWKGEDLDKDSGLHHLAHAGCELLFLLSFVKTKTGVDDRYKEETQNEPSKGI